MSKVLLAHIALFLANLIYAGNYTIAKVVMPDFIKPFGFILMRVTFAASVFFVIHTLTIKEKVEPKDRARLLLCALFGVAINQLMFFKGLNLTTPIHASLILTVVPIMVLIISSVLIREAITARKVIGIALGCAGAIILISYGQNVSGNDKGLLGDIFILINSISYSFYIVLVKTLISKYHPVTILKWIFVAGWFMVFPFGLGEFRSIEWSIFTPVIWICVLYVLILVSSFTYFFNAFALKELNPSVVSAYIYSQPLMAGAISILAGKDTLNFIMLLTAGLIFSGVYLVSSKPNRNKEMVSE